MKVKPGPFRGPEMNKRAPIAGRPSFPFAPLLRGAARGIAGHPQLRAFGSGGCGEGESQR